MKKLFLFLILSAVATGVYAQGNFAAVQAKLEKSNAELTNPKTSGKAATWLKNASIYLEIANLHTNSFFPGLTAQQCLIAVGKPLNAGAPPIVELNGESFTKYEYPNVAAYFDSKNVLRYFVETKTEMPDALEKATASALKALELDPALGPKVSALLKDVCKAYVSIADNNFNVGNMKVAAPAYYNAGVLGNKDVVKYPNSNEILYYSVIALVINNDFEKAAVANKMLIDANYLKDGDVLYYEGVIENALGKKDTAEKAYVRGFQEFPQNEKILNSLVAFYITNNEDPNKVIPYIKKAQEKEPNNGALFIAEGLAYDSMKDYAKSAVAYQKAVELAPDSFDALYNLGLTYYRLSEFASKELSDIDYTLRDQIKAKNDEIDGYQLKALDVFQKAHAIDPKEVNTVELLRSIYFRQRNKSPEMMAKYEEFAAKATALKQK